MGLWDFFGGNKIGPGHPRYERAIRKQQELENLIIENAITSIMAFGILNTLKTEKEEDIILVLKQFPNCPKFKDGNHIWGAREKHINNWKSAQKWLKEREMKEQEIPEYTKQLEQKIKDQEERIKKLEKQNSYEKE